MKNKLNRQSGFTLLELLMVVIIVGILATLALPAYIRASEKARSAEVVTMLGMMKNSIQRYCADSDGALPSLYTELDMDNPANVPGLNTRWTLTGTIAPMVGFAPGGGVFADCPAAGVAFQFHASIARNGGPCTGSFVEMDISATPPNSVVWAGQCA